MVVLCATEITNWGALVYAFIVASSTIAATEGWQLTHLLGAFTVAQLVAGLAGVWVGRRIDAVGPRALMTAGSILGAIALVVVADEHVVARVLRRLDARRHRDVRHLVRAQPSPPSPAGPAPTSITASVR